VRGGKSARSHAATERCRDLPCSASSRAADRLAQARSRVTRVPYFGFQYTCRARFATSEVADDMLQSGFALGGKRIHASVLFSDIRGFTALVESQGPEETIDLLNTYYILMFDAIGGHGGVVNQMIGDGLMALFGAPLPLDDCAGSAVAAGHGMCRGIDLQVKLCHILRAA